MPLNRVDLIIEGLVQEDGHLPLSVFAQQVRRIYGALARSDRLLSGTRERTIDYRVVDLRFSSPAVITVEARPRAPEYDTRQRVLTGFVTAIKQIEQTGTAPNWVDRDLLEDLKQLSRPVGASIRSSRVSVNGTGAYFDKELEAKITVLLAPEHVLKGSINGKLEAINLHDQANNFRIYPRIGPKRVTCHFPSDLQQQAVNAVNKYVSVAGILNYRSEAPFPHAIEVEEIRMIPNQDELPSIFDLKGIAPKATGNQSSEDFVRHLREEWA